METVGATGAIVEGTVGVTGAGADVVVGGIIAGAGIIGGPVGNGLIGANVNGTNDRTGDATGCRVVVGVGCVGVGAMGAFVSTDLGPGIGGAAIGETVVRLLSRYCILTTFGILDVVAKFWILYCNIGTTISSTDWDVRKLLPKIVIYPCAT